MTTIVNNSYAYTSFFGVPYYSSSIMYPKPQSYYQGPLHHSWALCLEVCVLVDSDYFLGDLRKVCPLPTKGTLEQPALSAVSFFWLRHQLYLECPL